MRYPGDISPEAYEAMEDGYEQGYEQGRTENDEQRRALLLERDRWQRRALVAEERLAAGLRRARALAVDVEHHRRVVKMDPTLLCADGQWGDLQPLLRSVLDGLGE